MIAFKGTRGPWRVLPEEMDKPYLRVRGTNLGCRYKIADVPSVVYEGVPDREAHETRANARLISAAPDLLEACHGVDVLYSELGKAMPGIVNTPAYDAVQEAVRKARDAIAKALGEQQ